MRNYGGNMFSGTITIKEDVDIRDRGNAIFISNTDYSDVSELGSCEFDFDIDDGYLTWIDVGLIIRTMKEGDDRYSRMLASLVNYLLMIIGELSCRYPDAWIVTKKRAYYVRLLQARSLLGKDVSAIRDLVLDLIKPMTTDEQGYSLLVKEFNAKLSYKPDEHVMLNDIR